VTGDQPAYRTLSIFDDESVPISGGELQWVPVRRRLGIRGFGINAFRAARKGDAVIEDHVESPGQEELYVLLKGRARLLVGEETVEISAGTGVFVPQPDVRRRGIALEDDTVILAIGGWRDRPYHSLPWEPIYLAQEAMLHGDWAAAAETLEREAGEHRDTAILQFRLACCHARLGEHELALEELRRAIEVNPKMREKAATAEDLASLRGLEDWPAAST
jgi:tetratricopeptide (TPR) repeat protein